MKNKNVFVCLAGVILFVVGIVMIFNSVSIANELTNAFITKAGHSYETSQLNTMLSGYITNTQICGATVSSIGGLATVLFVYLCLKKH